MIEKNALRAIFNNSLQLSPQESCLIVTDTIKQEIGQSFYDFARQITPCAKIIIIEPGSEHGQEPQPEVAAQMLDFNVEILITGKSLSHTNARRQASLKGARIASMPGVTADMINRCCAIDYEQLEKNSQRLHGVLNTASFVKVTTELGTDMKFKIGKNKWFGENGASFNYPGAFGNLPEGEVSFTPEDCDGVYVVDASFPELGMLESPLVFKVKARRVYDIIGEHAQIIYNRLNKAGDGAYLVAELGIGLNPKAKITGCVLEDEKVCGTIHIALGNNLSYGGDNDVPLHLDGVIKAPDIYVDEKQIMEKGKFLI